MLNKNAPREAISQGASDVAHDGDLCLRDSASLAPVQVPMSRHEREDLRKLIRQREKVLKSAARQRSLELLADFENQMGSIYRPDDDPIWAEAEKLAAQEAVKAQASIAKRCAEKGIVKEFSPSVELHWNHRGCGNCLAQRRAELRTMARTRIAAIEAEAIVRIEVDAVEAQTKLAMNGLTSDAARAFLDSLPTIESLMPALSFEEIAGAADPPIAEQLVSPAALRQRLRDGGHIKIHDLPYLTRPAGRRADPAEG